MSIAYFVHELADAAVSRRVRMLGTAGRGVVLLGFERARGGSSSRQSAGIVLGRTYNNRLLARALSLLLAIPRAWRNRNAWLSAEMFLARNLEMLALVMLLTRLTRPRARIVYECLDIHRLMLAKSLPGVILRALERFCLARTALVITSSPAFERNYFRAVQRFGGDILLAENKVLTLTEAPASTAAPAGPPWTIAWCGVLRCKQSFDVLRAAAQNLDGRLRVELWGRPALDQIPDFREAVDASPNMTFHGPYAPERLQEIYASVHFAWAIDFYEAGANSDWLLPNRLYESIAFGAVPIAIAGVETARWLDEHRVGVVLDPPLASTFQAFINQLTPDMYQSQRHALAHLPPESTRLTAHDCLEFAARIEGATP